MSVDVQLKDSMLADAMRYIQDIGQLHGDCGISCCCLQDIAKPEAGINTREEGVVEMDPGSD